MEPQRHRATKVIATTLLLLFSAIAGFSASRTDVADVVMKGDKAALRALLQQHANVNIPQADGATALHWGRPAYLAPTVQERARQAGPVLPDNQPAAASALSAANGRKLQPQMSIRIWRIVLLSCRGATRTEAASRLWCLRRGEEISKQPAFCWLPEPT